MFNANVLIRLSAALLVIQGLSISGLQGALANRSASQQGLLIRSKQDGTDRVRFEAVNSSNQPVRFCFKVSYTYRTLTDSEHTDSRTFDGFLGPGKTEDDIGVITEPKIQVHSVMILYVTNQ